MRIVKKIGDIELQYGLIVKEDKQSDNVIAETSRSADGSIIIFTQDNPTPKITAESLTNGWIKEVDVIALNEFFDTIPDDFIIEYLDESEENVIFAFSEPPTFSPIFDGSDWYIGTVTFYKALES